MRSILPATTIHAGPGARSRLPETLKAAGVQRPLLVTDSVLAKLPPFDDVVGLLSGFDVEIFDGLQGNPVKSLIFFGV